MTQYAVGPSSYGAQRGVIQYVTDSVVAAQVNSLIYESQSVFAGGAILSVNEGVRSRERQALLRRKYEEYRAGGPWAALAAALYTSTHDESRGSALDFGVTNRDGSNRALTVSEHSWLVTRGAQRGIRWTGGDPSFMSPPESWHFNGGYAASIPPIDPEEYDMTPDEKKQLSAVLDAVNKIKTAQGRIDGRTARIEGAVDKIKVAVGDMRTKLAELVKPSK